MKKALVAILILALLLPIAGCSPNETHEQIIATTLPVYEFTAALCAGTELNVGRLITETTSCVHDYTLKTTQMEALESAQLIVISGAGLEDFLSDALQGKNTLDASQGLTLLDGQAHDHHDHDHDHGHAHAHDPHIWLSPTNAKHMAQNICRGLSRSYPQYAGQFENNLSALNQKLDELLSYGQKQLGSLSCRELITFHDGFGYLCESFDLTVIKTVEEESGSEASAQALIELIGIVNEHRLPAIFTELNGSASAASVIAAETDAKVYTLDMALSGNSYFDSMYHNINTLREALQ